MNSNQRKEQFLRKSISNTSRDSIASRGQSEQFSVAATRKRSSITKHQDSPRKRSKPRTSKPATIFKMTIVHNRIGIWIPSTGDQGNDIYCVLNYKNRMALTEPLEWPCSLPIQDRQSFLLRQNNLPKRVYIFLGLSDGTPNVRLLPTSNYTSAFYT